MPAGRMLCNYTEKGLKRTQIYTILNMSLSSRQLMASGRGEITIHSAQLSDRQMIERLCIHPLYRSETLPGNITFA
jgi:hypothetical protein